jgi:hypothetical protein
VSIKEDRPDFYEVDETLYFNAVCATCKHRVGNPVDRCVKCKHYEV